MNWNSIILRVIEAGLVVFTTIWQSRKTRKEVKKTNNDRKEEENAN